jgi:hypothetical protein
MCPCWRDVRRRMHGSRAVAGDDTHARGTNRARQPPCDVCPLLAAIPRPSTNVIDLGPFTIHVYGLCYAVALIAAVAIVRRRWEAQGGSRELVYNVALWPSQPARGAAEADVAHVDVAEEPAGGGVVRPGLLLVTEERRVLLRDDHRGEPGAVAACDRTGDVVGPRDRDGGVTVEPRSAGEVRGDVGVVQARAVSP